VRRNHQRRKLWVDDLRTPPDESWTWARTAGEAIVMLAARNVTTMSLDHDMGGAAGCVETSRPIVLWLCEQHEDVWPSDITIHSWNPIGAVWLKAMCERYSPHQTYVPYIPSTQHWAGEGA
jgi:hypothetical protein